MGISGTSVHDGGDIVVEFFRLPLHPLPWAMALTLLQTARFHHSCVHLLTPFTPIRGVLICLWLLGERVPVKARKESNPPHVVLERKDGFISYLHGG